MIVRFRNRPVWVRCWCRTTFSFPIGNSTSSPSARACLISPKMWFRNHNDERRDRPCLPNCAARYSRPLIFRGLRLTASHPDSAPNFTGRTAVQQCLPSRNRSLRRQPSPYIYGCSLYIRLFAPAPPWFDVVRTGSRLKESLRGSQPRCDRRSVCQGRESIKDISLPPKVQGLPARNPTAP